MEDERLAEAAGEMSKAGASKGGKARVAAMSPAERKALASQAGKARWAKERAAKLAVHENGQLPARLPKAVAYGFLNLNNVHLPCYVLDDGTRVIGRVAMTEMLSGIKAGGALEKYLGVRSLKPFIDMDLVLERMRAFDLPEVQGLEREVKGLPTDLAIDICRGFVAALEATQHDSSTTKLTDRQQEMAMRASMFLAACAKVGLDALVDEATGYQYLRAEDALQVKLRAYLGEEMRPWEKTFPDELWIEFARLTNWKGPITQRPKYWGRLVMELIYEYLDPDVAQWLRDNALKPQKGQNYHLWLSQNFGLRKLLEHIWMTIGIAKTCDNIGDLKRRMAEFHGRQSVQFTLYLPPPRSL